MSASLRHVLEQGPMLRTLGGAALTVLKRPGGKMPPVPGRWVSAEVEAPTSALIRAFVRNGGGDPGWYKGIVPAHMFPKWAMPIAYDALDGVPYPLTRIMNAGCSVTQHHVLPAGERLHVRARLDAVDDDGRRAILRTRIVTGTASVPEALTSEIQVFVPLAKKGDHERKTPEPKALVQTAPTSTREIGFLRFGADAGLDFAKLTGDFNPIHWVPAYARASGFRASILHGFATLAAAIETITRRTLSGDVRAVASISARFTKPLVLPASVGVYLSEQQEFFVANAAGAPAYVSGRFTLQGRR